MARTVDALAQFFVKEDDDQYQKRMTSTDLAVDVEHHEVILLASGGGSFTQQISLGNVNDSGYEHRLIFFESNKHVRLQGATRSSSGDDLTLAAGMGNDIPAGGFFAAQLTATTELWVTNRSTGIATVKYWIFGVTASS